MNLVAIRNQYTEHNRRALLIDGMRRDFAPPVVRHINEAGRHSFISYADLNAAIADDAIERERSYFNMLGHQVEWKLYDYDKPGDLPARLARAGFQIGEEEAVMVAEVDVIAQQTLNGKHDVRRIRDSKTASLILNRIQNPVFEAPADGWMNDSLVRQMRDAGERMGFFAAYVNDRPVSAAWFTHSPDDNPFAGLWGGATLPRYRGRGLYRALIVARAVAAKKRGARYLHVDASPMSRPVLERIGFSRIATTWEAVYTPSKRVTR